MCPDTGKLGISTAGRDKERVFAVIDSTASSFGRDNKLPILIFGLNEPENIYKAVSGEKLGTIVNNG